MGEKEIFNATICVIGIAIFFIHSIDLFFKKGKRRDEKNLLVFFAFTAFHFATYLTFTLLKPAIKSDAFTMGFYTAFYIMNNLELFFLFAYAVAYIKPGAKAIKVTSILNLSVFAVFVILDIANIWGRFFFTSVGGVYTRVDTMVLSQTYQWIGFAMVFLLAVFDRKLSMTEKAAFAIYCLLPLVAIVLQNAFPGYAIGYLSIVVAIEILFLFANARKNAIIAEESRKNKEIEIRLMMSQIQPHFIYNALSSISTLIQIDPDKAQKALDDFTEYLRTNLAMMSETHCILFSDELRHIQTYLSLEQVRFAERVNVVYDIQETDFLVPPLSIQPLVENAVKHGILKKLEGGTVTLRTYREGNACVVEVKDDGVGFDPDGVAKKGHIGLQNASQRIASMSRGQVKVESRPGEGTTITVTFVQ